MKIYSAAEAVKYIAGNIFSLDGEDIPLQDDPRLVAFTPAQVQEAMGEITFPYLPNRDIYCLPAQIHLHGIGQDGAAWGDNIILSAQILDDFPNPAEFIRMVICHELGHAVHDEYLDAVGWYEYTAIRAIPAGVDRQEVFADDFVGLFGNISTFQHRFIPGPVPETVRKFIRSIVPPFIYANGKLIKSDEPPILLRGRLFVPLRATSQALGANVVWDEGNREVRIDRSR